MRRDQDGLRLLIDFLGEQTRHSIVQIQKRLKEMAPKQGTTLFRKALIITIDLLLVNTLVYWQNPIQSGIVFGVLLSIIITFMFLSSLAAISFWLLTLLVVVGLYKLYNYIMITFVGRAQDDIFE